MLTTAGQERESSEDYDSRIAGLFKRMRAKSKNDVPKLTPRASPSPTPPPSGMVDISFPPDKLSREEAGAVHSQMVQAGMFSAVASSSSGEDREELFRLRNLLLRGRAEEDRVFVPQPESPEKMAEKMRNMVANEQDFLRFSRRGEHEARWLTLSSYSGGVLVGTLAFAWGHMRLLGKVASEMTFFDKFMSKNKKVVLDVVLLTANTLQAFGDKTFNGYEKLKIATVNSMKLGSHVVNYGLQVGIKYMLGGLIVGPMGGVVGMILISAAVTANGLLVNAMCEYILMDTKAFGKTAAEQAATDEFLVREYKGLLSEAEKEEKRSLGGTLVRALTGGTASPALATLAVFAAAFNPYYSHRVDGLVDAVAINRILLPALIGLTARVWGSEKFRAAVLNPASEAFKAMKRWPGIGKLLTFMEKHYVFLLMWKVVVQVMKGAAKSALKTENLRAGMDAAYDSVWGLPQVQLPSHKERIDQALDLQDSRAELERASRDLERKRADIYTGGSIAAEQARVEKLSRRVEYERKLRKVTGEVMESKSCRNLISMLKFREERYKRAAQLNALWNLIHSDQKSFEGMSDADLGHAANVMGQASLEKLTWAQVLEWRKSRSIYERLRAQRGLADFEAIRKQMAGDAGAIDALSQALRITSNAEAEIVMSGLRTPQQLREMPAPWKSKVLEKFDMLSQLRHGSDATGKIMEHGRRIYRMSDPAYSHKDLVGNPEDLDELKLIFQRKTDEPLISFTPTPQDLKEWQESISTEDRREMAEWIDMQKFSEDRAAQEAALANGMEGVREKSYGVPTGNPEEKFGTTTAPPSPIPTSGSYREEEAPAFSPVMGGTVVHELEQGARLSTASMVQNVLRTSTAVKQAVSMTLTTLNALFYGGLAAMARMATGFFTNADALTADFDGVPPKYSAARKLSEMAKAGNAGCLTSAETYYLQAHPVTKKLVPFVNGSPVPENCYMGAVARDVQQFAAQTTARLAEGIVAAAAKSFLGPTAGRIVSGSVPALLEGAKTARLWRISNYLMDCGNMHRVELSRVPAKDQVRALVCHMVYLKLHDVCLTPGMDFVTHTGGESICESLAVWIDTRDLPTVLMSAKELYGDAAVSMLKLGKASGFLEAGKLAVQAGYETVASTASVMFTKDPKKQKAIDLLFYGSEGISTARFSKSQINSASAAQLEKAAGLVPTF